MPRIPYADPAHLSPQVNATVKLASINVMRMMAGASEAVFTGFGAFTGAFYTGSKLSPVLREVAILRVGYLSKSRYETFHHEAAARQLKMSETQIKAVEQGGSHPGVLNDAEQAVLDFTDDIVKNVRVGDATLAHTRKFLSDQELIDLILVIGCYMTVSRLLETTGVELDAGPVDWKSMNSAQASR